MTRKEEAFLAMGLKVQGFYTTYATEIASVPSLAKYYAQLDSLIALLIETNQGVLVNTKHYTAGKIAKRRKLEYLASQLSSTLVAYAVVHDNKALQTQAYFAPNRWRHCGEEVLVERATLVRDLAKKLSDDLQGFGSERQLVAKLETALVDFTTVIDSPAEAIAQRKAANEKLEKQLKATRQLFTEKLDVLMQVFETRNTKLFQQYKAARIIDYSVAKSQIADLSVTAPKKRSATRTSPKAPNKSKASDKKVEIVLSTEPNEVELPKVTIDQENNPGGLRSIFKNIGTRLSKVRLWGN